MTTNQNAAAIRIRAFLNSREGQTDRFAGTDDTPLTMSDLEAVLDQLDTVRRKTITDLFQWLSSEAVDDLQGTTLDMGSQGEVWIHTQAQVSGWLADQQRRALQAADVMAGRR